MEKERLVMKQEVQLTKVLVKMMELVLEVQAFEVQLLKKKKKNFFKLLIQYKNYKI